MTRGGLDGGLSNQHSICHIGCALGVPCRIGPSGRSGLCAGYRVEIGFAIADQQGIVLDHDNPMQGLGSYLVNANNSCNDCHTQPNYQPGGDPYSRQPKQVPLANYLAGGRLFAIPAGNFCSRNITPAPDTNLPAGLSRADFLYVMHTGCDPQDEDFRNRQTCDLLQVMPWPHYQDMKSQELNAIYSYLAALPSGSPPQSE